MSKNNLQQQAQMKPGRANKRAATYNLFEKDGDSSNFIKMVVADRKARMSKGYRGAIDD